MAIYSLSEFNKNVGVNEINTYVFDAEKEDNKSLDLVINKNCKIVFINLVDSFSLNLKLEKKINAIISFFSKNKVNSINFNADVEQNSSLTAYFADFINADFKLNANINLNKENATCIWNLASLSKADEHKEIDVSVEDNIELSSEQKIIFASVINKEASKISAVDFKTIVNNAGSLIFSLVPAAIILIAALVIDFLIDKGTDNIISLISLENFLSGYYTYDKKIYYKTPY